jgi:hypothetical protein
VDTGKKLKVLHTDRGGEFTSVEFGRYCAERGVERQFTAPYSPQQNGVVERRNQSVVAMARCMLKAKGLPGYFWGETVSTAVHILNRSPTRALDGKSRRLIPTTDPALLAVADGAVIAEGVLIQGHEVRNEVLSFRHVKIGQNASISPYAVLQKGTTVHNSTFVPPLQKTEQRKSLYQTNKTSARMKVTNFLH